MFAPLVCLLFFFFFKQKTAYEMRISDWSSDVCSSDLLPQFADNGKALAEAGVVVGAAEAGTIDEVGDLLLALLVVLDLVAGLEIGRASCRERVCQYV